MKELLIITTRLPWPLTSGFSNKNYQLIKGLSSKYSIVLCVIQQKKVSDEDLMQVSHFCKEVKIFHPTFFDIFVGFFRSLLLEMPIQFGLFFSLRALNFIKKRIDKTDNVLCSVIRSTQYVDKAHLALPVYDLADSLGQVYLRNANKCSGIMKYIYLEEGRRMLKYEKKIVEAGGMIHFFNQTEAEFYNSSNVKVVQYGVRPELLESFDANKDFFDGVVIFGRMSFQPNEDAVIWFAENVLEYLPSNIKLYAVGADPSKKLINFSKGNKRVIVTNYISDPYPAIKGAIASLAPIRYGGGIQTKVLEALAIGSICLVSPLAAKGMPDINRSGVMICNKPSDWIETIVKISNNRTKYNKQSENGKIYVQKYFSWQAYIKSTLKSLS